VKLKRLVTIELSNDEYRVVMLGLASISTLAERARSSGHPLPDELATDEDVIARLQIRFREAYFNGVRVIGKEER
jgi:hypothetical protein